MTAQKAAIRQGKARQGRGEHLKDEVYRQMFRLEAGRAGAETELAIALLRAWLASDAEPDLLESQEWLRKISPICLLMIEAGKQEAAEASQRSGRAATQSPMGEGPCRS